MLRRKINPAQFQAEKPSINSSLNPSINPSIKLSNLAFVMVFLLGIGAVPNAYAETKKREINKELAALLTKFDKNHDRFLDKTEISQAGAAAFTSRDANKDGFIEKSERKSWLSKAVVDDNGGKEGKLARKDYLTLVDTRFAAADRDNDGKISVEEFAGWRMGKSLAKLINPPATAAK